MTAREMVDQQQPLSPASGESPPEGAIRILVVDDEDAIRMALTRFLRTRGYDVANADSGAAALVALKAEHFCGMLCDVRMPGMSGLELLGEAMALDPDLGVVMLTAVNDAATATDALARGAADYLLKPVELPALQDALQRALHRRTLRIQQRRVEHLVRDEVAQRTRELEREQEALRSLGVGVVEALVNAMEARDVHLRGHSHRVAELGASIAAAMSLDDETVEAVRLAGRLMDVGKIGIREAVLLKPSALTPEEYAHVKEHVQIGLDILTPLKHLGVVLDYVRDHHEHFDGSGYPRGIAGAEISVGGRILCAADAFDAMTSTRPYRAPMEPAHALAQLVARAGSLVDPEVAEALRTVVRRHSSLVFIE